MNKYFLKSSDKERFFENTTRILISISEQLRNFEKFMIDLKNFFKEDNFELNKEAFENSRKLMNFFNGIIKLFLLMNRLQSLNSKISANMKNMQKDLSESIASNICTNENLIQENEKLKIKILELFKFLENCKNLNFHKIIEFDTLKNLDIKEIYEINFERNERQRCLLCLHDLDVDLKTQIFSAEFHILCINFWINVIDNNSPFN